MDNKKKSTTYQLIFIGIFILIILLMFILEILQKNYKHIGESGMNLSKKLLDKEDEMGELEIIENAWILSSTHEELSFFYQGSSLSLKGRFDSPPPEHVVADITYRMKESSGSTENGLNGVITDVKIKSEKIYGKILSVEEKQIEVEGYGRIPLEDAFKIYQTYGEIAEKEIEDILVGYEGAEIIVAEGKIAAIIYNEMDQPTNIRVLLKTDEFAEIYHQEVIIQGNCDYEVLYGESVEQHEKDERISLTKDSNYFTSEQNRITIKPKVDIGELQVLSLKRASGVPSYMGILEIEKTDQGFLMINEVTLEEYLYSVIPSEMPTSYGIESLKAQAICARSYAYQQMMNNGCAKYGAHVDDSVSYQVYNNLKKDEKAIQAVNETKGQVVTYEGNVVETYYFSTSWGSTSTDAVWKDTDEGLRYLQSVMVNEEQRDMDFSDETVFRDMLWNRQDEGYESSEPMYRWNSFLSLSQIAESVNQSLEKRYEINPDLILTKDETGSFVSQSIDTVGEILNIEVYERGEGGAVKALLIEGTLHTILVYSEYNIRSFLAPTKSPLTKADGSQTNSLSLLPSAYIAIDPVNEGDALTGFQITGGGNGHGVGMSQNGAKAMAMAGLNAKDIISFFFHNVEIHNLYEG
ncbi:MAG TPA: SpoIID/LytB domain-containing protein [Candidatus Merdenecus merdavium]|nr:SpoIID/LytB domain-containing protein [Candidatus Merdenecus merdavium]